MCLKKIFTSVVLINLCAFAYATEVKTASKTTPKSKASSTSAPATIETPKIAVFNFKGILLEKPPEISFSLDMELQQSLHDLLERLKKAEKDESLKAVVLT